MDNQSPPNRGDRPADLTALCCDRVRIAGGVFLTFAGANRLEVVGAVRFPGAHIGNVFKLSGADVTGHITLEGATVEGRLTFEDINIVPGRRREDERVTCFDLAGLRARGALEIRTIYPAGRRDERPEGDYRLDGAEVAGVRDDPLTAWPAKGHLSLAGFTYGWIRSNQIESNPSQVRIDWLALQWGLRRRFNPQPYEHLAKVFRDEGCDREADAIAKEKRDLSWKLGDSAAGSKFLTRVMGWLGHGYDQRLAIIGALFWWGLGIVWIWLAVYFGGAEFSRVHPAAQVPSVETAAPALQGKGKEARESREEESFDLVVPWFAEPETPRPGHRGAASAMPAWDREARLVPTPDQKRRLRGKPYGCPGVVVPVYALEMMLPIADLGQASDCRLESEGGWGGVIQVWRAIYQIIGAIIIAVLGMALTGLVRKD